MPVAVGFIGGMFGFGSATAAVAAGATGAFAIGAGYGIAFGGTILGSLTANLLTTVAFSALQRALMPSQSRGGGLTISATVSGEDQPETVILGHYATGGFALCPTYSHGKSNRYLTHVIEICSAPGATLERFMLGDEWVEFGPTDHPDYGKPVTGDKYGGRVWLKYYDGTQTTADPMLRAQYGTHPDRPWTADMIGNGLCYAILTFEYNQEKLSQVPRYRFEMSGIPLYDPRKDSTKGGVGSQRIDQPATWHQTMNAALLIWNIMYGIALPGGEVWGGRITDLSALPQSTWTAAMNRCDVPAAVEGGTEPMYRAGIEVSLSQPPAAAIEELLKACSGTIADIGFGWSMVAGAPPLPVYSFTDDDVIVSQQQDRDPFPSLQDTYNAVSAKFPDPKHFWETREAPQRTNDVWETSDAFGRRSANLSLPAVPFPDQVQRLTLAWLNDGRRFIQHTVSMPPDAAHVELNDTVTWTSARHGYTGKTFQVSELVEDPRTGIRQAIIRECDASDWAVPPDYILPSPPVPQPTTVVLSVLEDFTATPLTIYDGSSAARRGGIRLTWSTDMIADGLRYEIRLPGAGTAVATGTAQAVSTGFLDVFDGLLPATVYEARARLIAERSTSWSSWATVTTPDVRLGAADIASQIIADIADAKAEIAAQIGIKPVATLPATGEKPDQIVMLPDGVLWRWDDTGSTWTRTLYGGIKPGDVQVASFAAGLEPVTIVSAGGLPVVKSTTAIVWSGKLYRWTGTAYTAAVPAGDV
ncbi:phage tail protein, partial [Pseudorhodobacter sp.]|uniref:phage tail protein n=1 Tax=Pseudorhodobacter sp. TaxID=1934400 RepID=UPI00264715A1